MAIAPTYQAHMVCATCDSSWHMKPNIHAKEDTGDACGKWDEDVAGKSHACRFSTTVDNFVDNSCTVGASPVEKEQSYPQLWTKLWIAPSGPVRSYAQDNDCHSGVFRIYPHACHSTGPVGGYSAHPGVRQIVDNLSPLRWKIPSQEVFHSPVSPKRRLEGFQGAQAGTATDGPRPGVRRTKPKSEPVEWERRGQRAENGGGDG